MGIKNIQNMNQLNECLKKAYQDDDAIITSSWGRRDFNLKDPITHSEIKLKMKDIVTLFDSLSKEDKDKSLVGEIHDRICGLDLKGDKKLGKEWFGAVFLRNIRNISDSSHLGRLDNIENDALFTPKIKRNGKELINLLSNHPTLENTSMFIKDVFKGWIDPVHRNTLKNTLHYIVQEEPKTAFAILQSLESHIETLNPKEFTPSFHEFLNLKKMDLNARPEYRNESFIVENLDAYKENVARSTLNSFADKETLFNGDDNTLNLNKENNAQIDTDSDIIRPLPDAKMATIKDTPPIALYFTRNTPIFEQRQAHENAKKEGFAELERLGAIAEVISATIPQKFTKLEDVQIGILDSSVFSWEVTHGVREDIQKDGNRKTDDVVLYTVASQFNGCESPDRYTPQPGKAFNTYKGDHTQGPQAQLAFGREQVETINYMANLGFNGLVNMLTETTMDAVQHGYLTPVTKNIDEMATLLEIENDKIEYLCIANHPLEGTTPVHQILVSAPAFGRYNLERNLNEKEKAEFQLKLPEVQFQCALNAFRAQFLHAAKLSENGTVPVTLKTAGVGLGVFDNDPEVVAKAYYQAANEFADLLKKNHVKVCFQVFEKPGTNSDSYSADAAHMMKEFLNLQIFIPQQENAVKGNSNSDAQVE